MKKIVFILPCVLLLQFCGDKSSGKTGDSTSTQTTEVKKEEKIRKITYPSGDKTLNQLIAAEYAEGRTPVVYFWASWCGPCTEFKSSLGDPLMQDALNNTTLIMVDLDADAEKDKFSETYGVSGIPAFVKVDKAGEFVDLIDGGAWDENIPANMAPVLKNFILGTAIQ